MLVPLRTDSPLRSNPWINWILIALNVVCFLVQKARPQYELEYALNPQYPQLYQFVTYAFLHRDIMHLVGNMLFLYIFGNNVNDKMGHLGYLGFYLAGGVLSGISFVLWEGGSDIPMVGASGAIAAVTGAYLVLFPRSHITILYFFFLIGTAEIASLWFIGLYFVWDLIYLYGQTQTAHIAHIGGTVFGVTVCSILLAVQLLPRDQFDIVALAKQWNRRRQYRDAVAGGWNPYMHSSGRGQPAGPPVQEQSHPFDPRTQQLFDLRGAISTAISRHDLPRAADLYIELKVLDPQQVLPRQAQLDVANQLANQQRYPQAAEAYESFLRHYPKFEQIEQVELMLGLVYARYLNQYDKARECLLKASARLHTDRELEMARSELARIAPMTTGGVARPDIRR